MAATPAPPPTEPTAETSAASSFSLLPVELALLSSLSVTEKLLVAQATYELGSQDFKGVAKLLQGHALLKERGRSFFSADRCSKVYTALMKELDLDPSLPYAVNAPELVQVARKYYFQRVGDLHELMELEQIRFRIAYSEIDEIKAGKWDHKIHEVPSLDQALPLLLPPLPTLSPTISTAEPLPPTPTVKESPAPKAPTRARGGKKGRKGRGSAAKEVEQVPDVGEVVAMEVMEPLEAVDGAAGEGGSLVDGAVEGAAGGAATGGKEQAAEEEVVVGEDVEMAGVEAA